MNKDKLTDSRENNIENNIENKREDYIDSNGNPEDFIEDMTDPESTAIFKEAFYAEGKALEEEALRSFFMEDEEKKEALRLRILATAGRSAGEVAGESDARESDVVTVEKIELKAETIADENAKLEAKAMVGENIQRKDKASTVVVNGTNAPEKKKRHKFTFMVRWAAVFILACVAVLGMSMTSQAKGSGFWSSIQRLIGGETRWEQENNGEDRNISDPDEYKAIEEIQEKLGINIPKFFYWPERMEFSEYEIVNESGRFFIMYTDGTTAVYFEGSKGDNNASTNNVWQGEGKTEYIENDGSTYTVTEAESDAYGKYYYVKWRVGENSFSLSGMTDHEEVKKILKNIKN